MKLLVAFHHVDSGRLLDPLLLLDSADLLFRPCWMRDEDNRIIKPFRKLVVDNSRRPRATRSSGASKASESDAWLDAAAEGNFPSVLLVARQLLLVQRNPFWMSCKRVLMLLGDEEGYRGSPKRRLIESLGRVSGYTSMLGSTSLALVSRPFSSGRRSPGLLVSTPRRRGSSCSTSSLGKVNISQQLFPLFSFSLLSTSWSPFESAQRITPSSLSNVQFHHFGPLGDAGQLKD